LIDATRKKEWQKETQNKQGLKGRRRGKDQEIPELSKRARIQNEGSNDLTTVGI